MPEVLISISSPSSNDARDDGYVNLRVEDGVSGEALVDVDIPAGRWWRLCQGTCERRDAQISNHLERVGKRMEVRSVFVGRLFDLTAEDARAAAEAHDLRADYDTVDLHKTNQGWKAIFRRWVAEIDAAEEPSEAGE